MTHDVLRLNAGVEGVAPLEVGGGFVEWAVAFGDVGVVDGGVGGGDCEVYADFCLLGLVEETAPDGGSGAKRARAA